MPDSHGTARWAAIKLNCLFGLIIKPQTWGDLLNDLHGVPPIRVQSRMGITVTTS
jgi:hypothetical protein